jgi:hypothetical protein
VGVRGGSGTVVVVLLERGDQGGHFGVKTVNFGAVLSEI